MEGRIRFPETSIVMVFVPNNEAARRPTTVKLAPPTVLLVGLVIFWCFGAYLVYTAIHSRHRRDPLLGTCVCSGMLVQQGCIACIYFDRIRNPPPTFFYSFFSDAKNKTIHFMYFCHQ